MRQYAPENLVMLSGAKQLTGERYETERKKYGTVRFNPGLFN